MVRRVKLNVKLVLGLVVFVAISSIYYRGLDSQWMHIDEHEWVRRGVYFYSKYFIERDWNTSDWRSYYAMDMPKLSEYIYGGGLWVLRGQEVRSEIEEWSFIQDWNEKQGPGGLWNEDKWWIYADGKIFPKKHIDSQFWDGYELIVDGRRIAVTFGLLTILVVFYLGVYLGGYRVGLLASVLLASHPMFYTLSRQAMLETIPLFFFLIGVVACIKLNTEKYSLRKLSLVGMLMGLVVSAKLNGLAVLISCMTVKLWSIFSRGLVKTTSRIVRFFSAWSVVLLFTVLVFILLNPMLWVNPWSSFGQMLNQRVRTVQMHKEMNEGQVVNNVIDGARGFYRYIFVEGLGRPVDRSITYAHFGAFSVGLLYLFRKIIHGDRKWGHFGMFFLVFAMIVLTYIVVRIDRYYLPLVPFVVLIESMGLLNLFQAMRNKMVKILK